MFFKIMQSVNINEHFELFAFAKHADSHTEINLYRMLIVNLTSRKNIVIHLCMFSVINCLMFFTLHNIGITSIGETCYGGNFEIS